MHEAVRIMVVEDEAIVAADIQATLIQMGHTVVARCSNKETCLQRAGEALPDLVLMDINLGGNMHGVEAAELLRERHRIPVVFLTAYADEKTVERAKDAQPAGYLIKPYRPAELRVAVEMALHKHRLQERMEEQQQRFRALFQWAGVGIALLDANGAVLESNPTLQQMLGLSAAGLLGQSLDRLGTEEFVLAERRNFRALVSHELDHYEMETRYLRANGELGWGAVSARLLPAGHADFAIRVLADISPRRLAQVANFQENERRLLSSEIHDAVSQPLAGIFYRLQLAEQVQERDAGRAAAEVGRAGELVQVLLDDVSRLIHNLRSPLLDGENVVVAAKRLVADFRRDAGMDVEASLPDHVRGLGRLGSLFLFRIVQESLTNVRRHSGASRVAVRLHVDGPWLKGRIEDNGGGQRPDEQRRRVHYGIRGMRERAELIGGWLEVSFGSGTRVEFHLPLESEDES